MRAPQFTIPSIGWLRKDVSISALLGGVSFFLASALVGVSLVIYPPPAGAGANLELSWIEAYAIFFKNSFQCGKDYLFPYGPLGHLILLTYVPGLFVFNYFSALALAAVLAGIVIRFATRLSSSFLRFCFLIWMAGVPLMLDYMADCTLTVVIVIASAMVFDRERGLSKVRCGALACFLAFLSLIKVNLLVLGVVALVLVSTVCLIRRRLGAALLTWGVYLGGFLGGWLLAGQSPANIPSFFIASRELAAGYAEAMCVDGPAWQLVCGIAVTVLLIAALVPFSRDEWKYLAGPEHLAVLALIAAALFESWEHAFTRMDVMHVLDYFAVSAAIVFVLAAIFPGYNWKRRFRLGALSTCCLVSMIAFLIVQDPVNGELSLPSAVWDNLSKRAIYVAYPGAVRERLDRAREYGSAHWNLPRMKTQIGSRPIDLISWDQAVLFRNGFNWTPRPVFQSYAAYTPRLLRANAEFFRSDRAPDFVIIKSQTIDGRFPTLDDGPALQEILWSYEPVLVERTYLLLKRRSKVERPVRQVVSERTIQFGEEVPIDERAADCQSISLAIELSTFGQLRRWVSSPPPIFLRVRTAEGKTFTFRLVRGMVEDDLLLNPLLVRDEDVLGFFGRNRGIRIASIRLECPSPSSYRQPVQLVVKQFAKPSFANRTADELRRIAKP